METVPGAALKWYPKQPRALSDLCDGHCECPAVAVSWQVILTFMGVIPTKTWMFCAGCFGSQQDMSSKLIWLPNASLQNWQSPYRESPCSPMLGQLLQTVCACLFWFFPSLLSILSLCFLAQQPCKQVLLTSNSCEHPHFSSMTKVPLPMPAFVSPKPGLSTTAQYSALINLHFRLLHTLFSYSGLSLTLAKEKHWQENSVKVHTENEMVIHLLCIFWQQSFFK